MLVPPMTPPQLRAATSNGRLCYVKAGPGSGKTFLAVEAFGYLRFIRYGSDPRGVCGVTFARSARRELANRVRLRWGLSSVSWPNSIITFDELHRRVISYLVSNHLLDWPGGQIPARPEDSWVMHPDASSRPGKSKARFRVGVDEQGKVDIFPTNKSRASAPAFLDPDKLRSALESGQCTHEDIRNVLIDASDVAKHPVLNDAARDYLSGSLCHLIVDEAFDMNALDISLVERAIEAGLSVTIVGDPWQSLYEFRGSSPREVDALLRSHSFTQIDMPGEHRYTTDDMLELATRLFHNLPFRVEAARYGDVFDVVLAHDWSTLWEERRTNVLPAGRPSKLDGGLMASSFTLLLNEVVREQFDIEAAGVGEARRALQRSSSIIELGPVLDALHDVTTSEDAIWAMLREAFQRPGAKAWPGPKKMARQYMRRLMDVVRAEERPGLGLSVHQAKGLEWNRVLFLDGYLTTMSDEMNVLNIDAWSHRNVYVALTRARAAVRVLWVAQDQYAIPRAPIEHVLATPDRLVSVASRA